MGFIVATPACHSKSHCQASSSSSCTPHSLLIVETLGWHVTHHNSEQSTDVYTGFHGRSNAEQVDGIHTGNLWCERHPLKQPLSFDSVFVISLSGEFFTMESEGGRGWRGEKGVVILFLADFVVESLFFKASCKTVGALSKRFM